MISAVSRLLLAVIATTPLIADEAIVTTLADFEDDTVATSLVEVSGVSASDCSAKFVPTPARGQRAMALEIGTTGANAAAAWDLLFRVATPFEHAERVGVYCWLKEGQADLSFRIRDSKGQLFESSPQTIREQNRWVRLTADLSQDKLRRTRGDAPLTWPIEVCGLRIATARAGRQTVFVDELQVEHRVQPMNVIRGEFIFDEPTKMYRPGSTIGAVVSLENRSRQEALKLSLELSWLTPDGTTLKSQQSNVNLPPSGAEFRSRQSVDFSLAIDDPGFYRVVVRARAAGWSTANRFETAFAVMPTNRELPRGRSTFFGLRSNLLREPYADQLLEIQVARALGVHLLALDAPWELIEPAAGKYDFSTLEPLINELVSKNIAPLVALSTLPAWLPTDVTAAAQQQAELLAALARKFGDRLLFYQLAPIGNDDAARTAAVRAVRDRLAEAQPKATLLAPPGSAALTDKPAPIVAATFATKGESDTALRDLQDAADRGKRAWQKSDWWLHTAEPLNGAGQFYQAEAVLRHYVHAAAAGVAGVIWSDLRDDDADPTRLDAMHGLVRRDFSPKTPLIGFASAVGVLTGLRYAGPVLGTPDAFESALFIGSDRQVAVLLPRPNRPRPAALAPFQGVAGTFQVTDFERRLRPMLETSEDGPLLAATLGRPMYITLNPDSAQPEPQIGLGQPWLRVPATALCGEKTIVELAAPQDLQKSFLQVVLPAKSPVKSSLAARSIQASAGQTLRFEIDFSAEANARFESAPATIRVAIDGRNIDLPIEVRPLATIATVKQATELTDAGHKLGALGGSEDAKPSASGDIFAALQGDRLSIELVITDDRVVAPRPTASDISTGDALLLGLAFEGRDEHVEMQIVDAGAGARLIPIFGTRAAQLEAWTVRQAPADAKGRIVSTITIPLKSLGTSDAASAPRLRMAVSYLDDDGDAAGRVRLKWGGGLDGSRSTEDYRRATLSPVKN